MIEPIKQGGTELKRFERFEPSYSPNFSSIYANNAEVVTTFFDMNMTFGEVLGVTGDALNVERRARVVIPLGQAKLLALTLIKQLSNYEAAFHKVELHPKVIPDDLRDVADEWEKRREKMNKEGR